MGRRTRSLLLAGGYLIEFLFRHLEDQHVPESFCVHLRPLGKYYVDGVGFACRLDIGNAIQASARIAHKKALVLSPIKSSLMKHKFGHCFQLQRQICGDLH